MLPKQHALMSLNRKLSKDAITLSKDSTKKNLVRIQNPRHFSLPHPSHIGSHFTRKIVPKQKRTTPLIIYRPRSSTVLTTKKKSSWTFDLIFIPTSRLPSSNPLIKACKLDSLCPGPWSKEPERRGYMRIII